MRSIRHLVALGAIAATGCTEVTPADTAEPKSVFTYTLAVDKHEGVTIQGGTHWFGRIAKRIAIDNPNQPKWLHEALGGATYKRWDPAINQGTTTTAVFPSSWWPQSQNGIAMRWQGGPQDFTSLGDRDRLSPAEKYDLFMGEQPVSVPTVNQWRAEDLDLPVAERGPRVTREGVTVAGRATAWELRNHGNWQSHSEPASWWGHCNGWASYATGEKLGAPRRDVRVKLVDDEVVECAAGETAGCFLFKMADVEALMSELYFTDKVGFAGRRCNTAPRDLQRDEWGRPTDPACNDLNPGAFHVSLVGLLGRGVDGKKPAFVMDYSYANEVWNFPIVRYSITSQEEVTSAQAAQLIGPSTYTFNSNATRFVYVKTRVWMVSDDVSRTELLRYAHERDVSPVAVPVAYVLELSQDGTILGGEWEGGVQPHQLRSKALHPDFFWLSYSHQGHGENSDDTGGGNDNPYIRYSIVSQLLECANDAQSCLPGTPHDGDGDGDDDDDASAPDASTPDASPPPDGGSSTPDGGGDDDDDQGGTPPGPKKPPVGQPGSCQNWCGKTKQVPKSDPECYCDSTCDTFDDCCSDYEELCE